MRFVGLAPHHLVDGAHDAKHRGRHYRVEKVPGDPTHTRIEPLDGDDRREELERMLGGAGFLAALRE